MPIPGTHTARQKSPGGCDKIRQDADKFGPGVTPLWCVKGSKVTVESIHFDAKRFTADEAKKWLKDHGYKADQFEEAAKPEAKAAAPPPDFKGDVSVPVESVRGTDVEVTAAPPPPGRPDLADPPAQEGGSEGCYPEPGEGNDDFMTRCMAHPGMGADFPGEGDRHDACQVKWAKAHPAAVPAAAAAPAGLAAFSPDQERDDAGREAAGGAAASEASGRAEKAAGRVKAGGGLKDATHEASKAAGKATKAAAKAGTAEAHAAAAAAHRAAGKGHEAEARRWAASTAPRAQELANGHREARDAHQAAAEHHAAAAYHRDRMGAQAAEGPLLKCAGAGGALELLAADGAGGPPQFGLVAYTGVPMKLDGFFHPVVIDLEGLQTPRQSLPVLRQHDPERIAGHTTSVDVSAQRVKAAGVLSGMADHTADVLHTAKGGFPWQASVGASPQKMEFVPKGETAKVNGRNWAGPLFVARGATLREISLVPMGADGNTSAAVAATLGGAGTENGGKAMEFNDWLASVRLDRSTLDGDQLQTLEASWRAQYEPEAVPRKSPHTQSIEEIVTAGRAEAARQQKITEMVAQAVNEYPGNVGMIATAEALGRAAIDGKWDCQRAELEFLRARRPHGPGLAVDFNSRRGQPVDSAVLECAVARRAGLEGLEKAYPVPVLEAAERHFGRGLSLCELVGKYAERGGFRGHSVKSNLEAAWRAAKRAGDWGEQPPELRAAGSWGPSTQGASIGSLLANVANKFFRAAFEAVDSSWRQISAIRSANDFKQITTYSLTGDLTFKKLPPGGEIKHGQVDATGYTNSIDTYARMLGLDRRDLVNDDLGAFASIARRLGRGGAIALNKLFWGVFLNNSAFFTSGRNNLITGGGTTLQLSQLDVLNQKFLTQTDPDGNVLGIMPRILLVPPALKVTAQTLMASTMVVSGATTAPGIPSNNPWAGAFRVVTSPYMQDATLTGNSSTAWYLLADPNDLPVIETAFLNGAETPTVEQADADVSMLGQAFRGYFDIGVNTQEYRAGQKSAGA